MYTNEEAAAQQYYNDTFTDRAYTLIWGGEHIHYGIYEQPDDSIPLASQRTVELMAATVGNISSASRIIDLGAGYGGSARLLAHRYGCHVTCLNISEAQNQRNERLTAEQGLLIYSFDRWIEDISAGYLAWYMFHTSGSIS